MNFRRKNSRYIVRGLMVRVLFCIGMGIGLPGLAQPPKPTTTKQRTASPLSSTSAKLSYQSIEKIKADIEKSTNGPLYVKTVLQKHFVIDTIVIRRTEHFMGLPDSLAYHGKVGKVYGPYGSKNNVLLQILAKSNNAFNHISQIFIDTAVFTYHTADSLANSILQRLKDSTASFEYLAQAYSMGGEAATQGDLGWVAMGYMIPQIEKQLGIRKKGDVFKLWTKSGVHIIRKTDNAKEDTGYVLMMRVFL